MNLIVEIGLLYDSKIGPELCLADEPMPTRNPQL